jgi:YbgC/YbaW family acyl-CoA thioester hydrolase
MQISLPITVMAFETDFGGVVSNTRYVEYIERGRYALMHAAGLKIEDVWKTHGAQPIVRHVEIDYLGGARHEDELLLEIRVREHTRSTTVLDFSLKRGTEELMRATQTLAYINHRWRPTRVPDIFLHSFPVEN